MLRGLVVLFALLNVALYFWIGSDAHPLQSEREPQRLERQVRPEAIQVLPDLPTGAKGASGSNVPAEPASAASADAQVGALRQAAAELACNETDPLTPAQWATLNQALVRAGVPASAIAERRQPPGGRWMVYMGRYADEQQWQHKADELKRLDIRFERVSAPPGLDPGLSLGSFASAEEAGARLDELGRHGVHTARVVESTPPPPLRRLQLRVALADARWRTAIGTQRFSACPPASSASL